MWNYSSRFFISRYCFSTSSKNEQPNVVKPSNALRPTDYISPQRDTNTPPHSRFHQMLPTSVWPRTLTLGVLGTMCKLFLHFLEDFSVGNRDTLIEQIYNRPKGQGLITVSNHASTFDDPLLWGLLPLRTLWNPHKLRWSLSAEEVCYTNIFSQTFFSFAQGISVMRGDGLQQRGIDLAVEKLLNGDWVHIFSEGYINQSEKVWPMRWGVAKLISRVTALTHQSPIVLPFYHHGMHRVVPLDDDRIGFPSLFHRIHVEFGQPIDFQHQLERFIARTKYYYDQSMDHLFPTNNILPTSSPFHHPRNVVPHLRNFSPTTQRDQLFLADTDLEKALYSRITARIENAITQLGEKVQTNHFN